MVVSETMAPPPLPTARRVFAKPHLVAAAALAIGIGVDALALRRPIGIGVAIAMVVGLGVVLASRTPGTPFPSAFRWLMPIGLGTAVAVAWRASPVVVAMNLFGYAVIIAITMRLYDRQALKTWTLADYVWRGGTAAAGIVGDAGRFLIHDASALRPSGWHRIKPFAIGLVAVLPILAIFLALFVSADAVFADYVSRVLSIDVELARFISRAVTSVLLALVAIGSWRAVRSGFGPDHTHLSFAGLPRVPVVTGLSAVAALFATFVAVQVRYMFGGADVLEAVGITYSDYARRGFFEMVAVAFLMVLMLAVADWLVESDENTRWRPFDIAATALVALTLVVVASAAVRMRLYTAEFGLTELRFYTSVFMGWTAVVLVLVPLTVLRGRRGLFAFGLLISGLAVIAGVTIANPDALITQINLDRGTQGHTVDYGYLGGLSPDAVPTLAAASDEGTCLAAVEAAGIVAANDRTDWGWRSATWSHRTANAATLSFGGCD